MAIMMGKGKFLEKNAVLQKYGESNPIVKNLFKEHKDAAAYAQYRDKVRQAIQDMQNTTQTTFEDIDHVRKVCKE